jgi:hypothetical protein
MRRLILLGTLGVLCGCRNVAGPLQPQRPARVDDPLLSIGEQERNGRARLALPEERRNVVPNSGADLSGSFGRGEYSRD